MKGCRFSVAAAEAQHRGLYLDKFLPAKPERRAKGEEDPQADALRALAHAHLDTAVYKLAYRRWSELWRERPEVVCKEGSVRDRMAIGLGSESVLENGLRLQHTYGTPVIPGSSLKGVLRKAMPPEHRDSERKPRNVEWYLFGGENWPGAARFHDAWWIPEAKAPLTLDVLTPHHQKYMNRQGPPTDFDEPVPVQFLAVRGGFLFVIEAPTPSWREYLEGLLKEGLGREGVGAKRSAGYGAIDVR